MVCCARRAAQTGVEREAPGGDDVCWAFMFDRPLLMFALVLGLFGQVAFFADVGRGALPVWLRVAGHTAPLLPLLFLERPRVGARAEGQAARAWLTLGALSGVTYAGLSVASVALVAAGARPPGVWFCLALQAPGSVVALGVATAAARALRPLRPPPERPFVGAYRTRAFASALSLPRPRPPAPGPQGRWSLVGYLVASLAFSAVGVFMTLHPRRPDDVLMGSFCTALFGFGAWVFGEQLCANGRRPAPTVAARRRVLTMLWLLGAGLMYFALASAEASCPRRALVGLSGAAFTLLATWGHRRARNAKKALRLGLPVR